MRVFDNMLEKKFAKMHDLPMPGSPHIRPT